MRVFVEIKPLAINLARMKVDRYKTHDIELVIDRFSVKNDDAFLKRLEESMATT